MGDRDSADGGKIAKIPIVRVGMGKVGNLIGEDG
jgi:hypothetical protein